MDFEDQPPRDAATTVGRCRYMATAGLALALPAASSSTWPGRTGVRAGWPCGGRPGQSVHSRVGGRPLDLTLDLEGRATVHRFPT